MNPHFIDNSATQEGGAIYYWESGRIYLKDSYLSNNKSPRGGAITASMDSYMVMRNSTCHDHKSADYGGCIFGSDRANVTLKETIMSENFANSNGGAIYLEGGSLLTSSNSKYIKNFASFGGGALYSTTESKISIEHDLYNHNHALKGGAIQSIGIIEFISNGTIFMNNYVNTSQICSGKNGYGGALYLHNSILNGLNNDEIINISFKNNSAQTAGGAIYVLNPKNNPNICINNILCNFVNNKAPYGINLSSPPTTLQLNSNHIVHAEPGFLLNSINITVHDFYNNMLNGLGHVGIFLTIDTNNHEAIMLQGETSKYVENGYALFTKLCFSIIPSKLKNSTVLIINSKPMLPAITIPLHIDACRKGYAMGIIDNNSTDIINPSANSCYNLNINNKKSIYQQISYNVINNYNPFEIGLENNAS